VLVSARAEATPDATAVTVISTGEQLSWSDLDRNCRLWADAYRRIHVTPGEYVATMMPNRPDAMFAWLGCAWLRAVEVPVNTEYRGEWLAHAIDNSRARVVVTTRQYAPWVALVADSLVHARIVVIYDAEPGDDVSALEKRFHVLTGEDFFAEAEPAYDLAEPEVWDLASVLYTSGTTGPAKGILQPWGMQEGMKLIFDRPEFDNSVFYGFWPPFHSLGKTLLLVPAIKGGKLVLRDRFSVSDFWDDIRKHGCTATYTVSVIANLLYHQPRRDDDADNPLEVVIMGPVIPEVDDFKRRFGVKVYTTFGSSEIGSVFYSFMRETTSSNWRSCGRIAPDEPLEVAIVDDRDFPVGPGVIGELTVRPKHPWTINLGYLNMPEATVRAWRNGWFHTGDAFVYDQDGEHYFVDRIKDYIRRRGENISSFEVEKSVCSFPGVAQAAAVAVPSEVGEDEVMVFVVAKPDATVDPADLLEFLVDQMPRFALPRYVEVVDALPTTQATFRVQKNKLRERGPGPNTFDRLSSEARERRQ
jgi:carnitine-CoA ligase